MKTAKGYVLVLVTAPTLAVARQVVRAALQAQLAACGNLVPGLESHYWWQGKLEKSSEILIIFKTTKSSLPKLEQLILKRHPYDTPEILALEADAGNARYLDWISASVVAQKPVLRQRRS